MKKWVWLLIRLTLGSIFLLSGLMKLYNVAGFQTALMNYKYIPSIFIPLITYGVPLIEIILGNLLFAGLFLKWTTRFVVILLLLFTGIVLIQYLSGNIILCNCFGPLLKAKTDLAGIVRNSFLLLLAFFILKNKTDVLSLDKLIMNESEGYQIKKYWIEISSSFSIILIIFSIILFIINLYQIPVNSGSPNSKSTNKNIEIIKTELMNIEPKADSIAVLNLTSNIQRIERFFNQSRLDCYFNVHYDVPCQKCEDFHYLIKVGRDSQIERFIFYQPAAIEDKQDFLAQFVNHLYDESFGTGVVIKFIPGDETWCYHFMKSLRNVANANRNLHLTAEIN